MAFSTNEPILHKNSARHTVLASNWNRLNSFSDSNPKFIGIWQLQSECWRSSLLNDVPVAWKQECFSQSPRFTSQYFSTGCLWKRKMRVPVTLGALISVFALSTSHYPKFWLPTLQTQLWRQIWNWKIQMLDSIHILYSDFFTYLYIVNWTLKCDPLHHPVNAWSRIQGSKIQLSNNQKGNSEFISGLKRALRGDPMFSFQKHFVKSLFSKTHFLCKPQPPPSKSYPKPPGFLHNFSSAFSQFSSLPAVHYINFFYPALCPTCHAHLCSGIKLSLLLIVHQKK